MRRSNTERLGNVIREYLEKLHLDRRLKEVEIAGKWEEVVGKIIASKTEKVTVRDGTMYVHIRSSVVKNELMMIRNDLVRAINDRAGEEVVKEIVFR